MRIVAGRLAIRRAAAQDLPALHQIDLDANDANGWRYRGAVRSPNERTAYLWADAVLDQQVFVSVSSGEVLGYATIYDYDKQSRVAWLAAVGSASVIGRGLTALGTGAMIDIAFKEWPLRKLYLEATSGTLASFASITRDGTTVIVARFGDGIVRPDGSCEDRYWLEIDSTRWREGWGATIEHLTSATGER